MKKNFNQSYKTLKLKEERQKELERLKKRELTAGLAVMTFSAFVFYLLIKVISIIQ